MTKDYPHTKEEFTKKVVLAKLKKYSGQLLIQDNKVGIDVWFSSTLCTKI